MSKLYNKYIELKKHDKNYIYLFKNGIFFVALDEDATILSNSIGLKLTNLNNDIKKCGFPCSSLDKYLRLFNAFNLSVSIIDLDKTEIYTLNQFKLNKTTQEIIALIKNIDIYNLSITEAYQFIKNLKIKTNIINEDYL